jgi:glycerate kinase
MRILVVPDSFKGSLTSREAAEAMRDGAIAACPEAEVDICPLSDGGEGFADVLRGVRGGTVHLARVTGPEGEPVAARWTMLAGGTAVIETAECIGIGLLQRRSRAADRTTYGVGELMLLAVGHGATALVVALGGSATTDGGAGAAQALGVAFDGATTPITGAQLQRIEGLGREGRDPRIDGVAITVAVDVDNPLFGPDGAALVYGPQKGATPEEAAQLDAGLERLARLAGDAGLRAGDGAAGGLGYGLRVFAGGRVVDGVGLVLGAARFAERLEGCDLVLTGEGRLDATSARGKVVGAVGRACRESGVPVVAIVGAIGESAPAPIELGLSEVHTLVDGTIGSADAMAHARARLVDRAEMVVRSRRPGPRAV